MLRRYSITAIGALALMVPVSIVAQSEFRLRYDPPAAQRVQIVNRSEISLKFSIGSGDNDVVSLEATRLEGMTQRVVEAVDGLYSVRITFDSVRARMRPLGGSWRDIIPSARERAVARVVVNDRLQVVADAEFIDLPNVGAANVEVLRGMGGGFHVTLPGEPISTGATWTAELVYPLRVLSTFGGEVGVPPAEELVSTALFTLDSLVARGRDTLSFLTIRGRFNQRTRVSGPGSVGLTGVDGSVGASFIWSSSWNAFVSGAARILVQLAIPRDPANPAVMSRVEFDLTSHFQMRL